MWGIQVLTRQGKQFREPVLSKRLAVVSENRRSQYSTPKLVFAKVALRIEALVDSEGDYAALNTNFALEGDHSTRLMFLGAVCNSNLLSWVRGAFKC